MDIVTVTSVTAELQTYLTEGVIVVPTAGQLLGNPNFRGACPRYHALTLLGYEGETISAHDVGTRRGAYYYYTASVILTAIHDFVPETEGTIESGPPRALLVRR